MRYLNGMLLGALFCFATTLAMAGDLDSPAAPTDPASAMYTLEDVYNRIDDGTEGTKRVGAFTEPSAGPAPTGETLDDLYNLASERSRPAKTGQTPTVPFSAPTGSDGDLQKGVAWPNPRFTDNSDGTVTDNLTGLIWLKKANYKNTAGDTGTATWANALAFVNALQDGQCGLSDSSSAGDWRLPNVKELLSLIDWAYYEPALSNAAGTAQWTSGDVFTGVQSRYYWSSTTYALNTSYAWFVVLGDGGVDGSSKTINYSVWPVRGGQ